VLNCSYCDTPCQQTREHVIPRWYNDTPGEAETFSARAPLTHLQGDLIVRDVYGNRNNGVLSSLESYCKELYKRYFTAPVYASETVGFHYDGDRLIRWILKLSYNSCTFRDFQHAVRECGQDLMARREPRSILPPSEHPPSWN
jgi:hypothetical protein